MKNSFYFYSIVTFLLLFMYDLKWSGLCSELLPEIKMFFFYSILFAILFGFVLRQRFNYGVDNIVCQNNTFNNYKIWSLSIIVSAFIEYYYCGMIPLVATFQGNSRAYSEFTGIPTFHSILIGFSIFYVQYIFLLWIKHKKTKYMICYWLIFICVFVGSASRGVVINTIFITLLTTCVYLNIERKLTLKYKIGIVFILLFVLCVFGVYGNIRCLQRWNDFSYIESIGGFEKNYPKGLPKCFMWSYIYFAQALFNFNYNVELDNCSDDFFEVFKSIIPDFVGKRIWKDLYKSKVKLVTSFNTVHGWGSVFINSGILGCIVVLLLVNTGIAIVLVIFPKNLWTFMIIMNINVLIIMFNFTNVLTFSGLNFQMLFPMIMNFKFGMKK